MDAVLYADDDEDDDADFRFAVMVKETEIVAELAERIFGAWQSPGPVLSQSCVPAILWQRRYGI